MRSFRDYQGEWADIGNPPAIPFPTHCPRSLTVFAAEGTRYLEWTDTDGWVVPVDPPTPPEVVSEFTEEEKLWAQVDAGHPLASYVRRGIRDHRDPQLLAHLCTLRGKWLPDGRTTIDNVTCKDVKFIRPSEFGDVYLVTFSHPEYGTICWWTGANAWVDPGWTGSIRATLKNRTLFGTERQSTVSRVNNASPPT